MIERRAFGMVLGGVICAPAVAFAQNLRPAGKIGYVHPVTASPSHVTLAILRTTWRKLGYVDDQTALVRSAQGDLRRLPGLVGELVAQGADVIIVVGADAVRAAARTTTTTPIVAIDMETDPVRTGLIASYAKPGGNITGLFLDLPSLAAKWIELLFATVPGLQRVAFAWQPSTGREQLDVALAAAKSMGIEAMILEVDTTDDFDAKFSTIDGSKRTGIVQLTFPGLAPVAKAYSAAAGKRGLPTMTFLRAGVEGGILMSYGPTQEIYFPRAVELADKILRGEKAGDIPIERPTKFEFVINLKTAKALGLTIPDSILARADEVIE
ncbi:MAG: ABC transporter substrate-binding protein [Hyphomicrobiaceae bacterium]